MSEFRSVNPPKGSAPPSSDGIATTSPTTAPNPAADEASTPTRATFTATGMSAQRPLPSSPFPESISQLPIATTPDRTSSQRSRKSRRASRDSADMDMDMDMDGSDGENTASPGDSGSGNEASSKKKKTQRFYCTEYPPCNLSFTRSEHLARHIRKHTGERPFQCHCSRRFSRLDNLRQHAQTVHQNEEIPIDSPAAMGTRFQKQIRTDKMRPSPGARSRASTSTGVPAGRGHQKSLSTSVLGPGVSAILPNNNEGRRRPPAIVMPNDVRDAYTQDARQGLFDGSMRGPPSDGYQTPTSAGFSTGTNSPGWSTGGPSTPLHSRSHSMYNSYEDRHRVRRLSQPSSYHPFPSSPSRQQYTPLSPHQHAFSYHGNGSLLPSPTTPTSNFSRRESISSVAEGDLRRRTWHPDSASRLSQVMTPSQLGPSPVPPPLADRDHQEQESNLRLPGIESFDDMVRRQPSPMMVDSGSSARRPPARDIFAQQPGDMSDHSEMSLNRDISRLNIDQAPRDSATAWAAEASQAVLAQADQVRASHGPAHGVRFEPEPVINNYHQPPPASRVYRGHQHTVSAPINTYHEMRTDRRQWEPARAPVHTIQERRERPDNMMHPNMDAFQGFPARNAAPIIHQPARAPPAVPFPQYPEARPADGTHTLARYQEALDRSQLEIRRKEQTNNQQVPRPEQPRQRDMSGFEALVAAVAATTEGGPQDRGQYGGANPAQQQHPRETIYTQN